MRHAVAALFAMLASCHGAIDAASRSADAIVSRDEDPVIVRGTTLPQLAGEDVNSIGVFRWNPATSAFEPIPFQVDQRIAETFNAGTPYEFTETIFDVFGDDDGLFDDDDEIAFLFGDAGPQAPADGAWVDGAGDERLQVQVLSALPGEPNATRWAYIFTGAALPRSSKSYVSWGGSPTSTVNTPAFSVGYDGNWLLTGLRIYSPCGDGSDLLDRVKGRVARSGADYETEENWNLNSEYMGGLVGPVRAIRYVRGASSGANTIQYDIVYRARWRRRINLRVHPVQSVRLYFDWRPLSQGRYFSATVPAGVDVDGRPDPVPATFAPWSVVRSSGGGFVLLSDVPPNPLYQTLETYYVDDSSYNDAPADGSNYPDEDNSAYGDEGIVLRGLGDSTVNAISMTLVGYPLCAGVGDATLGAAYRQFVDNPLQQTVTEQPRVLGPVRTLQLLRDGADIVLSWQAVPAATSYEIYEVSASQIVSGGWTLAATVTGTSYRDTGAATTASTFYSVVPVGDTGAGDW